MAVIAIMPSVNKLCLAASKIWWQRLLRTPKKKEHEDLGNGTKDHAEKNRSK
jgi:hypothetical protein